MRPVSLKISFVILLALFLHPLGAQVRVTAFVTTDDYGTASTHSKVKGAGLRNSGGSLFSKWDSSGTNFTMNYGGSTSSITSVTQLTVEGYPDPFSPLYFSNPMVKIRHLGNSYINDDRNYFALWAVYSSAPAAGATKGTFSMIPPEMTDPEQAFLTNNINIGIDDIFQNTIKHLYTNNIERVDYVLPSGMHAGSQYDLDGTWVLVIDRGGGDPFKMAAILSVDETNNPTSYGPLITVNKADFGPTLLASPPNYCTLIRDPKFATEARPTSLVGQNIAGVIVTLSNMGVAIDQTIYGYSIFDADVPAANTDWTTYPITSDSTLELDIASVFGFYKTTGVVLATPEAWTVSNSNGMALLRFSVSPAFQQGVVRIERSVNGRDFELVQTVEQPGAGEQSLLDPAVFRGRMFYRLEFLGPRGERSYSGVKSITLSPTIQVQVYPNPCKDRMSVFFPADWQQQPVRVTLLNTEGRIIQDQHFAAPFSKEMLLSRLPGGTYYLRIENKRSGETRLLPIVINK